MQQARRPHYFLRNGVLEAQCFPTDFVLVVLVLAIAFLWAGFEDEDENEDDPASVF
jgi:hypothetical protein